MPCYDERSHDCSGYIKRLDHTTKLLCDLLTAMSLHMPNTLKTMMARVDGLATWWDDHQRQDRIRIERENTNRRTQQLRESIASKLTAEERKLLGL